MIGYHCKKKAGKTTDMWILNNVVLKNHWVKEEVRGETDRYIEINENENTSNQNFSETVKAILKGKFTSSQAYLKKKKEKSQRNNLTLHLKEPHVTPHVTPQRTRKTWADETQSQQQEANDKN